MKIICIGIFTHFDGHLIGLFLPLGFAATCRPSVLGSATKTRPPVAKQSGQCFLGPYTCSFFQPFLRPELSFFLKFIFYLPQGRPGKRLLRLEAQVLNYNFSPLATE